MSYVPTGKSESRYFETARRMDRALLELLGEKDYPYITVKELCARAGVNRSTYYLHYETMADLVLECVENLQADFLEQAGFDPASVVGKLRDAPVEELLFITPEYLRPYLTFIRDNAALFRIALANSETLRLDASYKSLLEHVLMPVLDRFHVAQENRRYLMAFYIHGLIAVVAEWLRGDCADPIDHLIEVMQLCVARP